DPDAYAGVLAYRDLHVEGRGTRNGWQARRAFRSSDRRAHDLVAVTAQLARGRDGDRITRQRRGRRDGDRFHIGYRGRGEKQREEEEYARETPWVRHLIASHRLGSPGGGCRSRPLARGGCGLYTT